jgi:hypothetical protein
MTDKLAKLRDELLGLLADVPEKSEALEALGHEIVRTARLSRDVANPIHDMVRWMPPNALSSEDWEQQVDSWQSWHAHAADLTKSATTVNSFSAVALLATSYSCETFVTTKSVTPSSPDGTVHITTARLELSHTLERAPLADEAFSEMRRLRLDVCGGSHRSPDDLLKEARAALEQPTIKDGGPTSILIAMRECIQSALAELIRRRPSQEPASSVRDKLASLGRQCGRDGLDAAHFQRLGAEAAKRAFQR